MVFLWFDYFQDSDSFEEDLKKLVAMGFEKASA